MIDYLNEDFERRSESYRQDCLKFVEVINNKDKEIQDGDLKLAAKGN